MTSVFGCISFGTRCGNVPNELIHRGGLPFLENHYRCFKEQNFKDCGLKTARKLYPQILEPRPLTEGCERVMSLRGSSQTQ